MIANLFGEIARDQTDFLNFPHGFIAPTVVMPADFVSWALGGLRDLERFAYTRDEILESLKRAATERRNWRLVYPPSRVGAWGRDPRIRLVWTQSVPTGNETRFLQANVWLDGSKVTKAQLHDRRKRR